MDIKIIAISYLLTAFIMMTLEVHCKQVSRQQINDCQKCDSKVNLNSDPNCYEINPSQCCRVCEAGEYRDGTQCTNNTYTNELEFRCLKCGVGKYQVGYNVNENCQDCPSPSITCGENEMISQDCNKIFGYYKCVPIPTTTSEMTTNQTTKEDSTTLPMPQPGKSDGISGGGIAAIVVVCILLAVFLVVLFILYHKHNQGLEKLPNHDNHDDTDAPQIGSTPQNPGSEPNELQSLHGSPDSPVSSLRGQSLAQQDIQAVSEENEMTPPAGTANSPAIQVRQPEIDDSDSYILKEGVKFWDFVIAAAILLPQNASELHPLYSGLNLDRYDVGNAEGNHVDIVEKRLAVLRVWSEQSRKTDHEKVWQLLSVMWKVKLGKSRRDLIAKCCQKVSSTV